MDKFRVFVYMLMMDASLKQIFLCVICISIFGAFSEEKSAHCTQVNIVLFPVPWFDLGSNVT